VTIYRPLLFAPVDPEVAAAGVPVRLLGIVFLIVLALTVTQAAQVVGTLLVPSLTIAGARQRLSSNPLTVTGLSVLFARRGRRRHPREPGERR
jgi:zinc/manganese transport system permease protein